MPEHIARIFDEELTALSTMLAQMGGLAEDQLDKSIEAIRRRDIELADIVIASDDKVDALELDIEEAANRLIAKRQPMASDLREIMVAIRIASDLERIGDLSKNIAKRTHAMTTGYPLRLVTGVERMGRLALEQLKNVLDAY